MDLVGKVVSLLFNMLSRLVNTFPSKEQVSFNFMAGATVCSDLEPEKITFLTVSIVSRSIGHDVMGPDAVILVF